MTKYAAIYARQSLDKKDSLSIESQIEMCSREIDGEYQVYRDKGFSGKNINRPAFEQLLEDIRAGKVSTLVCYRLDRVSRSIVDFGSIWELLSAHGVEFISVNEKFDTQTPIGRAMLYIIMVFAQLERETTAERITDNYYERVKAGAWPGGPAPYGYRIAPQRMNGMIALEPGEYIDVVKRIFSEYVLPDVSLGQIASELTAEGIPRAKRNNWDNVSLSRILHNPVYVRAGIEIYSYYKSKGMIIANSPEEFTGKYGCVVIGKRPSYERKYADVTDHTLAISQHEGVIPADLFLACQMKLSQNKAIKNTGKGKNTWMSGLMHCPKCGYSLKVLSDSGKLRVVCSGRTNYHICDVIHHEVIPDVESRVEKAVIERLRVLEADTPTQPAEDTSADEKLRIELYEIDGKIDNLVKALSESRGVTVSYINREIERLEARKNEIMVLLTRTVMPAAESVYHIDFPTASFDQKKAVAKMLIRDIRCLDDKLQIQWK